HVGGGALDCLLCYLRRESSWTGPVVRARSDPRCPPAATRPLSPVTRTNATPRDHRRQRGPCTRVGGGTYECLSCYLRRRRAGRAPARELDRILVVRRRRRVRYHRSPVPTPRLSFTAGSSGLVPAWAVARTSACLAISDEGELDERLRASSIGSSLSAGGDASAITGHPYQRH